MKKKDLINTLQMLVPLFVEEISKDPLKTEHALTDAPVNGSPLAPPAGDGWLFVGVKASGSGAIALWRREVKPKVEEYEESDYGHRFSLDGSGKCSACGMGVDVVANTRARCPGGKPSARAGDVLPDYAPTDVPERNPEGPVSIEPLG